MALYLKYRPQTFDELLKQDHITGILKPKILQGDYRHSNFLFYGPRGTGKTTTARLFAKAINCLKSKDGNPCNECESCIAINGGRTLDVVEIDAASHTQVDNIREEIIDKAPYPPSFLKKKVYIIDEVHMLSKNAFNALLKIMEEPPSYLVFVLATTEIHKVPETIISRCQVFTFKKIPVPDLVFLMESIAKKENMRYELEALQSIAKIADGCARDAVKYLDQVSILGDITQSHVTSFLGVASEQLIAAFLTACLGHDLQGTFNVIDNIQESGIDVANFIKQCLLFIEEHFQENPGGYILCADILKRVNYGLKTFPIPAVLFKMEVYNAIGSGKGDGLAAQIPQMQAGSAVASRSSSVSSIPSQNGGEQTAVGKEGNIVASAIHSDIKEEMADNLASLLHEIAHDSRVLPSLRSILLNSCLIEQQDGKNILYVFNKLQGPILQKAENWTIIEQLFKEKAQSESGLQIVTLSKEEYLSQKL